MGHAFVAAALLFEVYGLLALVDGFYFHLWRFRLFARAASRREHIAHTLHVVLFGPMALLMFVVNSGGWLLWLLVVVIVLDLAAEAWDVFLEKDSRADLGGLPSAEYWLHVMATAVRSAGQACVLVAKPAIAWQANSPLVLSDSLPPLATWVGLLLLPGAVVGVVVHIALLHPYFRRFAAGPFARPGAGFT